MGELLEFPSPRAQGLAYLDRHIRKLLEDRGADEALVDYAAKELTRVYNRFQQGEHYSFSVSLPEGLDEPATIALKLEIESGLEGIRQENHGLMLQLIAELVLTRVQLFQARRD